MRDRFPELSGLSPIRRGQPHVRRCFKGYRPLSRSARIGRIADVHPPLRSSLACLLVFAALGCTSVHDSGRRGQAPPLSRMVRTELYFGLSSRSSPVTEREFQNFLETSVTPRFPDGYTVCDAEGRWGEQGRTVKEPSRILILLHAGRDADHAKLELIRQEYRFRFDQSSVLRVDVPVRAGF